MGNFPDAKLDKAVPFLGKSAADVPAGSRQGPSHFLCRGRFTWHDTVGRRPEVPPCTHGRTSGSRTPAAHAEPR